MAQDQLDLVYAQPSKRPLKLSGQSQLQDQGITATTGMQRFTFFCDLKKHPYLLLERIFGSL